MAKAETISRKAGVWDTPMDVISRGIDENPFLAADVHLELLGLIEKTMNTQEKCTVDEYLNGDNDLSVCVDFDDDSWEDTLLAQIGTDRQEQQEV